MFRAELETKLKQIFGVPKVTFSVPGESHEQNTLFVEIQSAPARISKGRAVARISGALTVFAHGDTFPFGFFAKRISNASPENLSQFFFHDLDVQALNSPARLQNISEIRGSFVYLYSAQYDPNHGAMTDIEWTEEYILNPLATGDGQLLDTGDDQSIGVNK